MESISSGGVPVLAVAKQNIAFFSVKHIGGPLGHILPYFVFAGYLIEQYIEI